MLGIEIFPQQAGHCPQVHFGNAQSFSRLPEIPPSGCHPAVEFCDNEPPLGEGVGRSLLVNPSGLVTEGGGPMTMEKVPYLEPGLGITAGTPAGDGSLQVSGLYSWEAAVESQAVDFPL